MDDQNRQAFIEAYITCARWSSIHIETDENGHETDIPLDDERFTMSDECEATLSAVAGAFYDAHSSEFLDPAARRKFPTGCKTADMAGYDLWLTQNHHGAGFWDGDWNEPFAERLTAAAHALKGIDLYVVDNDEICC